MVSTAVRGGRLENERNPTSRSPSPVKARRIPITVALLALTASAAVVAVESAPAGATVSTSDMADSTVMSTTPLANYGASTRVTQDARPTTYGFVKFAVSIPAGQRVTRAIFRCWAGSANANGATLRAVPNDWSERTITWANAPVPDAASTPAGVTGPVTAQSWARADV